MTWFIKKSHDTKPKVQPSWYLGYGIKSEPEECSFYLPGKLAICHTRAVWSPQKRFLLAGDIWLSNYKDLLLKLGINPQAWQGSHSHLLAMLWEEMGQDCLNILAGMFAFAIWDSLTEQLWLVRDRCGARTLYYTSTGSTIWVAPRLRSLSPWHKQELDLVALRDYLCCSFVPGERTLWEGVRELRPGTIFCLNNQEKQYYWQPQESILNPEKSLQWHGEKL